MSLYDANLHGPVSPESVLVREFRVVDERMLIRNGGLIPLIRPLGPPAWLGFVNSFERVLDESFASFRIPKEYLR